MENKSIYSIMTTDTINDYIAQNPEFFGLGLDSDGNEIPDDVYELVVEKVLENATDGRLARMIGAVFEGFYAQRILDDVYECVDAFIYDEVNNILKSDAIKAN